MHDIFKVLINGALQRGPGGVAFFDGTKTGYIFPKEFTNPEVQENLQVMIDEHPDVFFVAEERVEGEGGKTLHILAYPKETVFRSVSDDADEDVETCRESV